MLETARPRIIVKFCNGGCGQGNVRVSGESIDLDLTSSDKYGEVSEIREREKST